MPIHVTCPNGHLLVCPDDRAGRQGKCPKCGILLAIPAISEPQPAAETLGPVAAALPPGHFWFLCPNGHQLNGPATLANRPGKCPHCDARFIIPSPDQESEAEEGLSFQMVDEEAAVEEPAAALAAVAKAIELDFRGIDSVDPATRPTGRPHVMAALFQELWQKAAGGGLVELHVRGGGVLAPNWFNLELSQGRVGVFGFQEIDGTYSVAIVLWETVERITLRGLERLPKGMFG